MADTEQHKEKKNEESYHTGLTPNFESTLLSFQNP